MVEVVNDCVQREIDLLFLEAKLRSCMALSYMEFKPFSLKIGSVKPRRPIWRGVVTRSVQGFPLVLYKSVNRWWWWNGWSETHTKRVHVTR